MLGVPVDVDVVSAQVEASEVNLISAGPEASPPRHWDFFQSHVNIELIHC